MTAHSLTQTPDQQLPVTSPLEDLSLLLVADMRSVNEVIMARMVSEVPMIPQLAGYLIAAGGKRMRPLMTLACAKLFGDEIGRAYGLAAAVEFIHTATLLHDDVVDESDQRRGQASANEIFGNQASVLVGDFLFSRAFELMVEGGSLEVLRILSRASAIIAEGEVLQLSLQNSLSTTLAQYERVIAAKTAALFAAACQVGPVIMGQGSEVCAALYHYGHHVGMAFQIADDVLDYDSTTLDLGKSIGDDFKEGKITAPVIYAYQFAQESNDVTAMDFWRKTIERRELGADDFACAHDMMIKSNALNDTRQLAQDHVRQARAALDRISDLCPPSHLTSILLDLAEFSVSRRK